MNLDLNTNKQVTENIKKHERVSGIYNSLHPEIYNATEQLRLRNSLSEMVNSLSKEGRPHVLDFGCGTGNLTAHLLVLNCRVTVADVTPSFVRIAADLDRTRTTEHVLNGVDLRELPDNSFDMVCTYSVLHHIPDYLAIIPEFYRVVRPGGIIYIDHEASSDFWKPSSMLLEFYSRYKEQRNFNWYASKLSSPKWWVKRFRKTLNPRYQEEGDIHVWPDDHIEWNAVRSILNELGSTVVLEQDYLGFNAHYDLDHYNAFAHRCNDMHVLAYRKSL